MDLTRDILTRDFLLNDASIRANIDPETGVGKGITGSVVDSWDFSDVDVVQFLEKRSLQDGMDAGDVFLGGRRLRMAGTLYGVTRALLFDQVFQFLAVMSPVLAQREEPADKGYRPLYFSVPTNRIDDYPDLAIDLKVLAMPRAKQIVWQRDQQGGEDTDALAIPWQGTWMMKDPSIYSDVPVDTDLSAGSQSDDFVNRGTYISPLNMLLVTNSTAGTITLTTGGTTFTITVPASTGERIFRYKGIDKVLTVEENDVELIRMDLFNSSNQQTHPIIPPGTSGYVFTVSGTTLQSGSHMWFDESYAG